jgi:hypothetical protein
LNAHARRRRSIADAERLGYGQPIDLPLLDDDLTPRSHGDVAHRCLALFTAVAVAYGFPRSKARAWTEREGLRKALTPSERAFLDAETSGDAPSFQQSVEALWALAWALGRVDGLDFAEPCADDFVGLFPNVKVGEPIDGFVEAARLRPIDQVAAALDLSYCLHWTVVQARLDGRSSPGRVEAWVVTQRRHALEWLVAPDEWDEVSLDT